MSFAQTLWDSLTSTYVHPVCTEPTNGNTSDRQEQLQEQQFAAFQQLGAYYARQQQCHSQPLQPPQCPVLQLPCQEYPYSPLEVQSSPYALQFQQPYVGAHQYTDRHNNGVGGGYSICQPAQYGVVQPTASPSPSCVSPNNFPCHIVGSKGQAPSTHCDSSRPLSWAHDRGVYGYWQQQQQQQPYTQVGYNSPCTGQRQSSDYNQHSNTACNSYLSPAGVPFDLHQPSSHVQTARALADNGDNYQPRYTEPQPGIYKAFSHAYRPLVEDGPNDMDQPQYETHSATMEPLLTFQSSYSDEKRVDKQHNPVLLCYSPKPGAPRTRPCQGRKDKYLQWDKQYGFGFAAPVLKANSHQTARHSLTTNRGGLRDSYHTKRQLRNVGRVPSHRTRFGGEREHDDSSSSTHANLSKESSVTSSQTATKRLFRARDHHGRSLRSARFSQEDRGPVSIEKPSSRAAHSSHTAKLVSKTPTSLPAIRKSVEIDEHNVGSRGILQTTASEVSPISTTANYWLRKAYVPRNHAQNPKGELISHEHHMPVSILKGLAGGIQLSADRQQAYDTACGQEDRNPGTQIDLADRGITEEYIYSNETPCGYESSGSTGEPVVASNKAIDIPSQPCIGRCSTENCMVSAPPSNHFKEPASLPDRRGKKLTAVYDKFGNSKNNAPIVELLGEATVKEEDNETGDNGVVVDRAYDSDSSDGGIALSLSDLETELWAVIKKTGRSKNGSEAGVL